MTPSDSQPIKVTVLGSGTCVPSLVRSACAVLMGIGDKQLVFDTGPGTMRRLLEAGTDIFNIDYLFYSHFHPDHTAELVPFLFANKYPDASRRQKPLTVVGGPGLQTFVAKLEAVYGHWIQLEAGLLDYIEMDGRTRSGFTASGFRVAAASVEHNPESLAYRIESPSGASVVYSGDTDVSDRLVALAHGVGLLICESAAPDDQKIAGHLTPALAGEIATKARAKQLMLTHFYPLCDAADMAAQCRRTYEGPLLLAEDLMHLVVE